MWLLWGITYILSNTVCSQRLSIIFKTYSCSLEQMHEIINNLNFRHFFPSKWGHNSDQIGTVHHTLWNQGLNAVHLMSFVFNAAALLAKPLLWNRFLISLGLTWLNQVLIRNKTNISSMNMFDGKAVFSSVMVGCLPFSSSFLLLVSLYDPSLFNMQ